ncbi:MAG: DUF1538 domain-containing protein [Spirochaetaceae bacterium]|nr:DUF1538 domain-containing protein [Spirochaetaceae bacterium]
MARLKSVNKVLQEKIMEAFGSVLPITLIVLIASVVFVPMPSGTILVFLAGAALLIIGMGFFTMGADMAMMPMGEGIGIQLTKVSALAKPSQSAAVRSLLHAFGLFLIIIISFIMGLVITIAEPDLQVLAKQVSSIPSNVLIFIVGVGVGIFLVVAVLRIVLKIQLSILLLIFYAITFTVAYFTPNSFIAVAFDSGGVTTGPITVPFILAMGVGVASIRSDKNSQDDSFGLVSLCSIGPILAVMLLGIFYNPSGASIEAHAVPDVATSRDVVLGFAEKIPHATNDVLRALAAIVGFFVIFQIISRRFKRHQISRIAVGFVYTFIGLVVFLTGVEVGFIPVGQLLGSGMAASPFKWVLIPLSMVIGYFIVSAEPAVHVLNKQVEEISSGAIPQKVMSRGLAIGMAGALAITMTRILVGIPIMYILIPGYAFALLLTFFVPKIFTGIAFDSGGVCSGPLTSTFLLPLAMGVCEGAGRELMLNAFGIVAMVAMAPLIVVQFMGLVYGSRMKSHQLQTATEMENLEIGDAGTIIEFEEVY